jgi:hypothetical protein
VAIIDHLDEVYGEHPPTSTLTDLTSVRVETAEDTAVIGQGEGPYAVPATVSAELLDAILESGAFPFVAARMGWPQLKEIV